MSKRVNLLDYAPGPVITAINWALAPFEDPIGLDRPRWADSCRYQGIQDFLLQAANGVWGQAFRMGISWGYVDPTFATNWGDSDGIIKHRTSYHVIYPDQPVKSQFENWIKYHPKIKIIPRVIDLELENDTPPAVIASQVWEMSERVADHDGVRPIIYSRRLLINEWLAPYWSGVMLNEHYYWLAQYLWDRTREHPGPPTLPSGVDESRVVLHQTADKKATLPGEAESLSFDYDRWEIGNPEEMSQWISNTWGSVPEPPTDPDLEERVYTLECKVGSIEEWIEAHEQEDPADPVDPGYFEVKAKEQFALAVPVEHDEKCPGEVPPGKPTLEPPSDRVVVKKDQVVKVVSKASYSCKDDPTTPEILAAGRVEYYMVYAGQPGAGQFMRKDKTGRV